MKLALALALVAPAAAFQAPATQKASVVVKDSIGIKHGRISMMAFLGMMVQELGITFPGSINLDGSVAFSDILKDGMGFPAPPTCRRFGLVQILAFGGIAETVAMPATEYTGGPQNLPGGYDGSAGTIPGGYPFTTQIEDPTARARSPASSRTAAPPCSASRAR
ncbi:chlorophyll A-B binding protein [Aureococcus anophagefferens]|uniref:Chlorophyll A-B binding protein n=1 Tax=Aureococcus anophagefferens TaxID=44056 RepID=A0ABR1FGC8_AURAN